MEKTEKEKEAVRKAREQHSHLFWCEESQGVTSGLYSTCIQQPLRYDGAVFNCAQFLSLCLRPKPLRQRNVIVE
jgi:hypothetical protein